jgi:heptosyltransferase-3
VTLLAPAAPAAALLGPGLVGVDRVLPWERADLARLFGDEAEVPLPETLSGFDVAVAYTRNEILLRRLGKRVDVLSQDPSPPLGGTCHASLWLSQPLAQLAIEASEEPPTFVPTAIEERDIDTLRKRLGEGFLALHPGSGSPRKNWPLERFEHLATQFAGGRPWLLVRGPAEVGLGRSLEDVAGAVVANNLPIRNLGALLAHAGAYVGNDSGVSHLAAAWGAPTVALFGPTDPNVWSPVGPRVVALRAKDGAMESLATDTVEDALRSLTSVATSSATGLPLG